LIRSPVHRSVAARFDNSFVADEAAEELPFVAGPGRVVGLVDSIANRIRWSSIDELTDIVVAFTTPEPGL
jgi:hypothetical protein